MTNKSEIIQSLESLPNVELKVLTGKHEGFTYFTFKGKEIAHFDNDLEIDVKLTKKVIAEESLEHPKDSQSHPNRYKTKPHWIVLQLEKFSKEEIVRLVSKVIKN